MQIESFEWYKYTTDKNMSGHGYNSAYDYFLTDIKSNVKKIMEIGTRTESIKLWLDYFVNCKMYGVDLINPEFISDRFIFEQINQGDENQWDSFIKKHGKNFDVIIDDGPHTTPEQLISFNKLFETLSSGGVYIIEDLHTTEPYDKNYMKFRKGCDYSFLDILKEFERCEFKENKYLYNLGYIKSNIDRIKIIKAEKNRWPNNMTEPSEIVFIYKK